MSLTKFLLWAIAILIVAYAFNVNIPGVIGSIFHGLQQMHSTQAGR